MVALNSTFHPFPSSVPVEQITIDDFDELSNSFSLKIGFLFTILTDFFISDVLAMLFILYDKYGEDSMKRPIYNRLNSQFAYPLIISNFLSRPAWTWRVYFGPISSTAADAAVLIGKGQGKSCTYNIIDCRYKKWFLCVFWKTYKVCGRFGESISNFEGSQNKNFAQTNCTDLNLSTLLHSAL